MAEKVFGESEVPAEFLDERAVGLGDYVEVLRRRWRGVAIVALTAFLLSVVWSFRAIPVYEAKTTLQLSDQRPASLFGDAGMFREIFQSRADPILSEIEILKTRSIAEDTAKDLRLQFRLEEVPESLELALAVAELAPEARGMLYEARFLEDPNDFRVLDDDGNEVGRGRVGKEFRVSDFAFTIASAKSRPGDSFQFSVQKLVSAAKSIQARTTVTNKRNTNIMEVAVRARRPDEAAATANGLVSAYVRHTVKRQSRQAFSTKDFISKQLDSVKIELERAEAALGLYKQEKGILALSDEARRIIEQWTREESARARVQMQREHGQAILDVLDSQPDASKPTLVSTVGIENPVLADLAHRLTALELERVQLEQGYAAQSHVVRNLEAQIKEAREKLREELQGTLGSLEKAEGAADSVLLDYESQLKTLPEAEFGLASLMRTSKVNEELYTLLLQKFEEARIAEAAEIGNAWQVDKALPEPNPISPRWFRNLVLGLFLGLFLGVGLAFVSDHMDRSIRSVQDVERAAGIATFGIIPDIPLPKVPRTGLGSGAQRPHPARSLRLIHRLEQHSFAAESYRSLRTNIQFATPEVSVPVYLLTSAGPHEGKSLTCANLAIALAQVGRRVLVVDADLRRPVQHRFFQIERDAGLSDVLAGKLAWRDAVHRTEVEYLEILPGGHLPPNPAELLSSPRVKQLLAELKQNYDLIIIDTPPVIPFTDATVIGTVVDGAFLVVRAGVTTPEAAERSRKVLESVGAKLLGAILNGVSMEQGLGLPGYYRHYYGYYYGYYYQQSDEEREHRGWRRFIWRIRRSFRRALGKKPPQHAHHSVAQPQASTRPPEDSRSGVSVSQGPLDDSQDPSLEPGRKKKSRHKNRNRA